MTSFILKTDNARARMVAAWEEACRYLELGNSVRVTVDGVRNTRSLDQNAKLHAICGDISKQKKWAGKRRDTEAWKRLLCDAWARTENKAQVEIVPALDGDSVVNLGIQTRRMTVGEMADLIEFAQAYAVENDVRLGT